MRTTASWIIALLVMSTGAAASPPLPALAGAPVEYCVVAGDSLDGLAARFGVDAATIARRNGVKRGARLGVGTILHIDAVHIVPPSDRPVVVNVPQRMLFVTGPDGVHAFPIAVGRASWPTPRGTFTILTKEEDPTWDVPVSIQAEMQRAGKPVLHHVPPSPDNPLGAYWLGLSLAGIGIHGTNAPSSVYRITTHGCIRVHPDRIGEVFSMVEEGTEGEIIYQPLLVAVVQGRVYIEAHPDAYHRAPVTMMRLQEEADRLSAAEIIDWSLAADALALKEGVAVDASLRAVKR
jgi:L,D-transpeptidase ErfK/SrfK